FTVSVASASVMSAHGSSVWMNVWSSVAASWTALPIVKFVEISMLLEVSAEACDWTFDSSSASLASPTDIGVVFSFWQAKREEERRSENEAAAMTLIERMVDDPPAESVVRDVSLNCTAQARPTIAEYPYFSDVACGSGVPA